jgi:hypothetical protein
MVKIGRPAKLDNERKIRDSTYYDPDVYAWLKAKADKREASISSLVNVILKKEMNKEKANS